MRISDILDHILQEVINSEINLQRFFLHIYDVFFSTFISSSDTGYLFLINFFVQKSIQLIIIISNNKLPQFERAENVFYILSLFFSIIVDYCLSVVQLYHIMQYGIKQHFVEH